jgi:putative hydrolase of HD superfamily
MLFLLLPLLAAPCCAAAGCGSSSDPAAVVAAQVEAYNKHDVEAFLSCYADEATVSWLDGKQPTVKGKEGMRALFAFLAKIPPAGAGFGVDVVSKTVTGPTVATVEHTRGLPPGAKPRPDTLVIYEVRDGKIVNCWFAPAS